MFDRLQSFPIFRDVKVKSSFGPFFWVAKRSFDILMSLLLLPVLVFTGAILLLVNPFVNPGPLVYTQDRMGLGCIKFKAYKFRSMRTVQEISRNVNDPLELDRITPVGRFLRKTRLDELPQIMNVLMGEMSLIGPRPDYYPHALELIDEVPDYKERHSIRPGISGLAQIEVGYIETVDAASLKVEADLNYIENLSLRNELKLIFRTLWVILRAGGR